MEIALRVHVVQRISSKSLDVLDRFSQSFHHMKALYMPMMGQQFILPFVKGRCHGNQLKSKKPAYGLEHSKESKLALSGSQSEF